MVTTLSGSWLSGPGLEASPTRQPLCPHSLCKRAKVDPSSLALDRSLSLVPVAKEGYEPRHDAREKGTPV